MSDATVMGQMTSLGPSSLCITKKTIPGRVWLSLAHKNHKP
jgi:hypothetical protein